MAGRQARGICSRTADRTAGLLPSGAAVPCGYSAARPRGPVQATFRDERTDAYAQVTAITRGLGAETCCRPGRSAPGVTGGQPCRGCLQFAFYGRVSTEGHQDPLISLARKRKQAVSLVAGHGRSSRSSPTSGRAGPWRGRAAALVAALADPDLRPSHLDSPGRHPRRHSRHHRPASLTNRRNQQARKEANQHAEYAPRPEATSGHSPGARRT